jgi:hypothetical protein
MLIWKDYPLLKEELNGTKAPNLDADKNNAHHLLQQNKETNSVALSP